MFRRVSMVAAVLGSTAVFAFSGTALAQDRDCADFSSQQEAQAAFGEQSGDPERLDADNDNIACESLAGNAESPPAEGSTGAQGPSADGGGEDSGAAPVGGVETGHGGMADHGSNMAVPAGLTGLALLAAGGVVALRRWPSKAEPGDR